MLKVFWFFAKNLIIRVEKIFSKKIPFDTHSTANLPPLVALKIIQVFFRKTHLFLKKNPNFQRFEKYYFFSRILRQVCFILVQKIQVQKRERTSWTQLENIG